MVSYLVSKTTPEKHTINLTKERKEIAKGFFDGKGVQKKIRGRA